MQLLPAWATLWAQLTGALFDLNMAYPYLVAAFILIFGFLLSFKSKEVAYKAMLNSARK